MINYLHNIFATIPVSPSDYVIVGSSAAYLQLMDNSHELERFLTIHGGIGDIDMIARKPASRRIYKSEKTLGEIYRRGLDIYLPPKDHAPFRSSYTFIDMLEVDERKFERYLRCSNTINLGDLTLNVLNLEEVILRGMNAERPGYAEIGGTPVCMCTV